LIWLRQQLLGDFAGRVNKALRRAHGRSGIPFAHLLCERGKSSAARGIGRTASYLAVSVGRGPVALDSPTLTESMLFGVARRRWRVVARALDRSVACSV